MGKSVAVHEAPDAVVAPMRARSFASGGVTALRIASLLLALAQPSAAAAQWVEQPTGSNAEFRGLAAVDSLVAWTGGRNGAFARTTDGGATWVAGIVSGAGSLFRQAVTAEQWAQQVAAVVAQVGAFQRRELQKTEFTTELPNGPQGEYMVLTYSSAFANLPNAREVVILQLEDGEWKTIGYLVQPGQG